MMLQTIRRYLGPLTLVVGIVFFVYFFSEHASLDQVLHVSDPVLFAAAFLLIILVFPLHAVRWWLLYRFMGVESRFLELLRTFIYYQVSGFAPGVLPQFANLDHYGREQGLQRKHIFSVVGIDSAVLVVSAFIVFSLFLAQYPQIFVFSPYIVILGIPVLLALLHPTVLELPLRRIPPLIGKDGISLDLRYSELLVVTGIAILNWMLSGTGFYLLIRGLGYDLTWFAAISIYAGSWAVGFLILIIPGGLGIREASIVYLLGPLTSTEAAILIAGIARIWSTAPQIAIFAPFAVRDLQSKITKRYRR